MTKGQVQLNETVLVAFVLALLLVAGMFAYFQYSSSRISHLASTLSEQEGTILLNSFIEMPEVGCDQGDCLDTGKILPFVQVIAEEKGYYSKMFGAKRIVVSQVYPASALDEDCTVATYASLDYPNNCRQWVVYDGAPRDITQRVIMSTPVSLYWPETGHSTIGRLDLELYA